MSRNQAGPELGGHHRRGAVDPGIAGRDRLLRLCVSEGTSLHLAA